MQRTHLRKDVYWTFDIETTTLITGLTADGNPERNAIIWSGQFFDGTDYTQVRSLADVVHKLELIAYDNRDNPYKVAIFVHNLSYEFQFIKDFFKFEKILCTSERKIIAAETDQLVFRCSYFLSNMSLDKFLKSEGVPEEYRKTNMDYLVERYPWTPLTQEEERYCANDVIGLHMAISKRIAAEHNADINNLPLTSTGYVRKACRKAVTSNKKNRYRFIRERLDRDTFIMCHKAFRGGNTHANKAFANKLIIDTTEYKSKRSYYDKILNGKSFALSDGGVGSDDIRSSYPTEIALRKYPTKFFDMKPFKQKEFDFYLQNWEDWGMLIEVTWKDLELINPLATPVPYISVSKCKPLKFYTILENGKMKTLPNQIDNGRILKCEYCSTVITEVDYMIIRKQYKFSDEHITRVKVAKKKYLSKELVGTVLKFYYDKTTLKQDENSPDFDPEKDADYNLAKRLLNGIYGMHVTNPCKPDYVFNENTNMVEQKKYYHIEDDPESGELTEDELTELLLDNYYSSFSSFLSYQVGIWVTAYARYHLELAISVLGNKRNGGKTSDLVYCDTDSVKFINPNDHIKDIEALNEIYITMAKKRKAYVDYNGKRYYLGIFEFEGISQKFKTFGAKKYIYGSDDHFKITISGVPKKKGYECIEKDISKKKLATPFDIEKGYVFRSIKTTSAYMDHDCLHVYEHDGKKVYYASNIAMYPNSYTLGLTYDFELLLNQYKDIMED